jgi:hypothetical protein
MSSQEENQNESVVNINAFREEGKTEINQSK